MKKLLVRAAREDDVEACAEIHACAYPEPGGFGRHARYLTHGQFGGLDRIRVAERDGAIVAHAALYPLEVWLGGKKVPVGGIGSLAVAPDARRAGVAGALIDALHAEIVASGGALALLHPFRESYYARRGYASVSPAITLKIAMPALEAFAAQGGTSHAFAPFRLEGRRLQQARELYEAVAATTSGRVARSESRWLDLFSREHRHWMGVARSSGEVAAFAAFSYDGHAMSRDQTLVVHELTAKDGDARRALLGSLAAQRDQVADIELTVAYGDPLALAFEDGAGPRRAGDLHAHWLGTLSGGPMVRLLDVGRALASRGYAAEGELTIACEKDPPFALRVSQSGAAQVVEARRAADVELSRASLASIAVAGMRPSEASDLGLLRGTTPALATMEKMFSGPRFLCLDPF